VMRTMLCREAREILWPADDPRISDDQVEAALRHAENCPHCGKFLLADRRIAELIRASVPRVSAPRELRERLYTSLARERAGSARQWPHSTGRRWIVASLVLVGLTLAVGGYWLAQPSGASSPVTAFAEDYLRRMVEQESIETDDRDEVAAFFARELGQAMPPPQVPGFAVQRAVICLLGGRRGGVVEYQGAAGQLTYYVIPLAEDASPGRPGGVHTKHVDDAYGVTQAARDGLGVATWWDGEHQHALVGVYPLQRLRHLAPLFACPTSRL